MAISGIIEFHASSGAPCAPYQMDLLVPNSGQGYNRIAQFGVTGPGSFLFTSTYQDTTYITNEDGSVRTATTASGKLSNLKYVNSTSVNPNSSGSQAVSGISRNDATIRVRFTEPSGNAVTIQNARFRCVALNAGSGVDSQTTIVSGLSVQVFEVGVGSGWTQIGTGAGSNALSLGDRATASIMHDFHIGISVAPLSAGVKRAHGYLISLEYI